MCIRDRSRIPPSLLVQFPVLHCLSERRPLPSDRQFQLHDHCKCRSVSYTHLSLMKCIAGLLKPQNGNVYMDGAALEATPYQVVEKGISLVPEGRWIFPNLTVEENLLLGGYTNKKRDEFLKRSYEMFPRLGERKKQRAGTMSGGEQQMLAIARGLMSNPKVLLLDEPSLGLAPLIEMCIRDSDCTEIWLKRDGSY